MVTSKFQANQDISLERTSNDDRLSYVQNNHMMNKYMQKLNMNSKIHISSELDLENSEKKKKKR